MTSKERRDHLLDHTLKHGLSSAAAWGLESECLDAETLAAWAEGGLDRHQAALADAHLSHCGQCQELIAALALALPPAGSQDAKAAPAWWRWWLVPLTAAAAVGLWMVVPEQDYLASPAPGAEIAKASPAAPAPPAAAPSPERETTPPPVPAESTAPPRTPASTARATPALEVTRPAVRAAPQEARAEEFRRPTPAPAAGATADRTAAASPPAPVAAPAPAVPPPAPSLTEKVTVTDRPVSPPAAASPAPAVPANAAEIVSPDSRVRWRYSAAGLDYSADGGATWEQVSAAIGRFVTAGTSPSPTVCWLVARGGGVYVTGDGRNFFRARFPEITNLVAVTATSRTAASVRTADGRRFVTSDGGVTWREQ